MPVQNWPVGAYSGAQMLLSPSETIRVIFDGFFIFWYGKTFRLIFVFLIQFKELPGSSSSLVLTGTVLVFVLRPDNV